MSTSAILGTLGAVVELYDKAHSVIDRFNTFNPDIAPPKLCRLYFLLLFLNERNAHVCAPEHKLRHLKDLLRKCEAFLTNQERAGSQGPGSFTWPSVAETGLEPLINAIDDELLRLQFYIPGQSDQESSASGESKPSSLASTGTSKARKQERRGSLKSIELPVTITLRLDHNDSRGRHFQLKWVNIVERDDESRTLQYRNEEGTVIVSHRIARGQLPFVEDELEATQVNFNEPQEVVVQINPYETDDDLQKPATQDGHQVYKKLYPQYDFDKAADLDTFIEKVRERNLVGKFIPDRIYANKKRDPLARCKVVRMWKRNPPPSSPALGVQFQPEVTLTFENTRDDNQIELKLKDFGYQAWLVEPRLMEKDYTVEISTTSMASPRGQSGKIAFLFQRKDKKCAEGLRDKINAYHYSASLAPRIGESISGTWRLFGDVTSTYSPEPRTESTTPSIPSRPELSIETVTNTSDNPVPPTPPGFGQRLSNGSISDTTIVNIDYERPTPSPRSRPVQKPDTPPEIILGRTSPTSNQDFEIAVICALATEAEAVVAAFDQKWDYDFKKSNLDTNSYSYGSIGQRNIVLVYMAGTGKIHATGATIHCSYSFPKIKLCLVVGVCGGVPRSPDNEEIWLGDVAISEGIVQYDFGRLYPGIFKLKTEEGSQRASNQIASLLSKLKGWQERKSLERLAIYHLDTMKRNQQWDPAGAQHPGPAKDVLFRSSYQHKHHTGANCSSCKPDSESTGDVCEDALKASCKTLNCDYLQVVRQRPDDKGWMSPAVHFGHYASGDVVMKSGMARDNMANGKGIIAIEMEGAAAWNSFATCLVIKGICDYADSHKNKDFQKYAAATAAAYTKAFLEKWHRASE